LIGDRLKKTNGFILKKGADHANRDCKNIFEIVLYHTDHDVCGINESRNCHRTCPEQMGCMEIPDAHNTYQP
jgi:hypothetical protein